MSRIDAAHAPTSPLTFAPASPARAPMAADPKRIAATAGADADIKRPCAGRPSPFGTSIPGSFPIRPSLPAFDGTDNQKANMVRAYGWLSASLGVTAASACVAAAGLPPLGVLGSLAIFGTELALLTGVMSTDDPVRKRVLNAAFNVALGTGLGGLVSVVGAPVLLTAGAYTAGLVGTMMAASLTCPAGSFSSWDGPLFSGLLGLVVCGAITAFLPPSWSVVASLDTAQSLAALGLFSAFIVRDTSRMAEAAQAPSEQFDPIGASLEIYLDVVNIFVEFVKILERAGKFRRD